MTLFTLFTGVLGSSQRGGCAPRSSARPRSQKTLTWPTTGWTQGRFGLDLLRERRNGQPARAVGKWVGWAGCWREGRLYNLYSLSLIYYYLLILIFLFILPILP